MTPAARRRLVIGATVAFVVAAQQSGVSPSNFGGSDEWLLLDLSSRGAVGVPYAHRPLVHVWQAVVAFVWPDDLRAFWAFATLCYATAGLLTAALARRVAPGQGTLALLAGVFAAGWAPLDYLRLDTVLICGYAGFTVMALAALLLFVESWRDDSPWRLALAALLGFVASLGVESVVPLLAVAPALAWPPAEGRGRRFAGWCGAWFAALGLAALRVALPVLSGAPSYQTGALGMDLAPWRVVGRLAQLLGMQAVPLFTSSPRELLVPSVAVAALATAAGVLALGRDAEPGPRGQGGRALAGAFAAGLLLALAAHASLALTPVIRTPARTQVLAAPGFGLALASALVALASLAGPRARVPAAAVLAAAVAGIGTGRVRAMQSDWNASRNLFPAQSATLADLVRLAPGLQPDTLVVLLDPTGSWPTLFTFRHGLRHLYGDDVGGVVHGAADFLYPWRVTREGIAVSPWPVIRREWQVAPRLHAWREVVVAERAGDGTTRLRLDWPSQELGALPPGAAYAPLERVQALPLRERQRRVLYDRRRSAAEEDR